MIFERSRSALTAHFLFFSLGQCGVTPGYATVIALKGAEIDLLFLIIILTDLLTFNQICDLNTFEGLAHED